MMQQRSWLRRRSDNRNVGHSRPSVYALFILIIGLFILKVFYFESQEEKIRKKLVSNNFWLRNTNYASRQALPEADTLVFDPMIMKLATKKSLRGNTPRSSTSLNTPIRRGLRILFLQLIILQFMLFHLRNFIIQTKMKLEIT